MRAVRHSGPRGVRTGVEAQGIASCSSPWACPVCASRLSAERADYLRRVASAALRDGWRVEMVTLTLRHAKFDRLDELLDRLNAAWLSLRHGVLSRRVRAGDVGAYRVTEVTHGANGWHPHYHVVCVTRPGVEPIQWGAWTGAIARAGGSASDEHGVNVVEAFSAEAVSGYVEKANGISSEAAGSANKGRSVWELALLAAGEGTEAETVAALPAWFEYLDAVHGRRAMNRVGGALLDTLAESWAEAAEETTRVVNDDGTRAALVVDSATWTYLVFSGRTELARDALTRGKHSEAAAELRAWLRAERIGFAWLHGEFLEGAIDTATTKQDSPWHAEELPLARWE